MKSTALAVVMMVLATTAYARGGGESPPPEVREPRSVDETRAATADGLVDISTISGSVAVRGWDRPEVKVTGTLGADVVALDVAVSGDTTTIDVRVPEPGSQKAKRNDLGSDLEVFVPAGSSIRVSSLGAEVEIAGVAGLRECQTLGGSITVKGGAGPVIASTLTGDITLDAPSSRVVFSTMRGAVTIRGATAEITGSTMNGPVTISGARIVDADLSTMDGDITIDAEIAGNGRVKVAAELGGRIELVVPADTEGRFTVGCRSDDLDMSGFTPRGKIEWIFRDRASTSSMRLDVWGTGRSELPAAAARTAADVWIDLGGRMTARGLAVEMPAARIIIGGALNEFTVGAGGARVYLEVPSVIRQKAEGPRIVLKTR